MTRPYPRQSSVDRPARLGRGESAAQQPGAGFEAVVPNPKLKTRGPDPRGHAPQADAGDSAAHRQVARRLRAATDGGIEVAEEKGELRRGGVRVAGSTRPPCLGEGYLWG